MKEVKCLKCNMKLAEIRGLSITFENGVKPIKPAGSADGLIVIPFECPKCKIFQMEPIIHDYNLNIENGMKVYFDGDSEWYASPWDLEKTRLWIIENYQLDKNFELEECDLDNDCMWYETNDKKDIEELGDYDEQCKGGIGDLRRGIEDKSIIERLMTFREVLKIQGYSNKPYEIATTN